ncbi:jg4239, partial [Pararge aegeria aegeria]
VFGTVLTLLFEWMLGRVGDRWADLAMCGVLALGTAVTAAIQPDLRRQAAQNKA